MNGRTLHLSKDIMSWIDHEEVMLLKLAKTVQLTVDRIIVPVFGIGLAIWVVSLYLSVVARYSECAEMISLCSR
jgi:hypothetical protein